MSVPSTPLVTDLYQLTMMQGYHFSEMKDHEAVFDLFFRKNPFNGGFTVFLGLSDVVEFIRTFHFSEDDLAYLDSLKMFSTKFLDYLKDFRFTGDLHAVAEGTVVFPHESLIRVKGALDQCQILETALLNIVNFQSLIATKAARICLQAGEDKVVDFGLRRAQGVDGGLTASKAAYIGGCSGTSNMQAGKIYKIPVKGTHAHSWVTAFRDELTAFRRFAEIFPQNTVLLVDTYDTLGSGLPNAIKVGLEMKERGEKLTAIRLDSGDLAYLSIRAREMLDEAGLTDTKIIASNELDEYVIHELNMQGARIDLYGVGTKLVTANDDPSLSGVYKMCCIRAPGKEWEMRIKISERMDKSNLPGIKQIYRLNNHGREMIGDIIELEGFDLDFSRGIKGIHPFLEYKCKYYDDISDAKPLLSQYVKGGEVIKVPPDLKEVREYVKAELRRLNSSHKRLLNPHIYKVSLGPKLADVTHKLRTEYMTT
ncbi:MAG: nicotinate phosphoribosyltransferase [Spirochaetes bacterium]|nr:MAG: nicotinate phosphoribosyltransferase [Spirochaetota bacterium]